eukprot:758518-Hanusia_phi.AAC.1
MEPESKGVVDSHLQGIVRVGDWNKGVLKKRRRRKQLFVTVFSICNRKPAPIRPRLSPGRLAADPAARAGAGDLAYRATTQAPTQFPSESGRA